MTAVTAVRLPKGITTKTEMVTPEIAAEWLEKYNMKNRGWRYTLSQSYAADMAAGRWYFTGDAIQFGESGVLQNGQHRLHAVVMAGEPIMFLVIRGLPDKAQEVMDSGSKRTAADALTLHGENNTKTLASVAGMILTEGLTIKRKVTTAEAIETIEDDPTIVEAVETATHLRINGITPTVLGYLYWRLSRIDADRAAQFFTSLADLTGLTHGSPILALHRRLAGDRSKARSTAYRQETISLVIMAWNAWIRGDDREIIKLARTATGRLSIPEPLAP